jgi:hypothetical protein
MFEIVIDANNMTTARLIFDLDVSGQLHAPAALSPRKVHHTDIVGGWVGLIASVNNLEK